MQILAAVLIRRARNVKATIVRDFARKRISLKATRKIKKGQEIFNTYGSGFRIVR
jgi:SET domain-containing protein